MASEIAEYLKALAYARSASRSRRGMEVGRTLVDALFLRRYDKEYLEEMKGIADGASAAGATFESRALDLIDIAAINSDVEVGCLDAALEASAQGLEGKTFREPASGEAQGDSSGTLLGVRRGWPRHERRQGRHRSYHDVGIVDLAVLQRLLDVKPSSVAPGPDASLSGRDPERHGLLSE